MFFTDMHEINICNVVVIGYSVCLCVRATSNNIKHELANDYLYAQGTLTMDKQRRTHTVERANVVCACCRSSWVSFVRKGDDPQCAITSASSP